METTSINRLKLSYGPMTVYEFEEAKKDEAIRKELDSTTVYIVAKRHLPFFRIIHDKTQRSDDSGLESLCLKVDYPGSDDIEIIINKNENNRLFSSGIDSIEVYSNQDVQELTPQDPFHAFSLFDTSGEFVIHTNFDRLIQLNQNNIINVQIKGDITPLITYEVLYVGQCVKEHIFDRYKSHHALQKILIDERIIPKDYDKVNELLILPFSIQNSTLASIDDKASDSDIDSFVRFMLGEPAVPRNAISRDCEKALIHAMSPQYNRVYKSYPKSKDGLYQYDLDTFSYIIDENLILAYGDNEYIYGNTFEYSSVIRVHNNNEFEIRTFKND